MTNFNELNEKVIAWAVARNIIAQDSYGNLFFPTGGGTLSGQAKKCLEEAGEVVEAAARIDALGEHCLIEDGDRALLIDAVGDTLVTLILTTAGAGLDIVECLGVAYNNIKDRKGKMVNGVFVKETSTVTEFCPECGQAGSHDESCITLQQTPQQIAPPAPAPQPQTLFAVAESFEEALKGNFMAGPASKKYLQENYEDLIDTHTTVMLTTDGKITKLD